MKISFQHFENIGKETALKEEILDDTKINSFGIVVEKQCLRNGEFKKFVKRGFVRTGDKVYIGIMLDRINEIKNQLRGKIRKVDKVPIIAIKRNRNGVHQKKAINWEYQLK